MIKMSLSKKLPQLLELCSKLVLCDNPLLTGSRNKGSSQGCLWPVCGCKVSDEREKLNDTLVAT